MMWTILWRRQAGLCALCHTPMSLQAGATHLDHRVPIARGGRHEEKNLQLAHAACNLRKGARLR